MSDIKWDGNYRALVTEVNIDDNNYGAVRIFVPAMFVDVISQSGTAFDPVNFQGPIAYPANSPVGCYNKMGSPDCDYQSSVMVPLKGSWVWVFFDQGNPNFPYYFAGFQRTESLLPPENRGLSNSAASYTLFKAKSGRSIVICDSEDQERIEICGKKRQISGGPIGDNASVYNIDGNSTTILLDERSGKEKLLIRTVKGDFIHIDVDTRQLQMSFESDIIIETKGALYLKSAKDINIKSDTNINCESGTNISLKGGVDVVAEAGGKSSIKAGGICAIDGATVLVQNGASSPATPAVIIPPLGLRDT